MDRLCESKINEVLSKHGGVRRDGRVASERTVSLTKEVIYSSFRRLYKLGYKLQSPYNLQQRHIRELVRYWWFEQKMQPKTLQNNISRLRRFAEMMGRAQIVGKTEEYLPDVDPGDLKVEVAARRSKSVASQNIDTAELFRIVDAKDLRLGLMLRMELAFGLRRQEALKCDVHAQDRRDWLEIFPGQAKGGRPRFIRIMTNEQRQVLDFVKSRVRKGEVLGWPHNRSGERATLKQNLRRYMNLMAAVGLTKKGMGVTGHSLRAQFAENSALLLGMLPGTLGGNKQQLPKDEMTVRLKQLSQLLGHNREAVMSAYIGSLSSKQVLAAGLRAKEVIQAAVSAMQSDLPVIPGERLQDCVRILEGLQLIELDLTLRQVHVLWLRWSSRSGVEWVKPDREILRCLEAVCPDVAGHSVGVQGIHI